VLLDCGHGVLSNLGRVVDPTQLDAVIITHAHVDHFADVYALKAALRYAPEGPAPPLPLYLPDGLFEQMGCLLSDTARRELAEAFTPHTIDPGAAMLFGGLSVTAHNVDHIDPTYAICAEADGARVCYTSDTAASEAVTSAARGCQLLLAEATLPERFCGAAPHLTARQAGEIAGRAGVSQLVLVHTWPTHDRDIMRADARAAFDGDVVVAREMDVFEVASATTGGESDAT
jgi:ribonuclease BN (tRNA processing enzyme)